MGVKTTIDLPDSLLLQAKITACRRHTTLKNLVVEGLEHVIHSPATSAAAAAEQDDGAWFENDAQGVPVLKRRGVNVTNNFIESLREAEGI